MLAERHIWMLQPNSLSQICLQSNHTLPSCYSVYFSTCQDMYYNLALEDWVYTNTTFEGRGLMRLWRTPAMCSNRQASEPLGRGQHTWWGSCRRYCLPSSRQPSFVILHCEKLYNCREHLQLLADTFQCRFGLQVAVNERDDLNYLEYNISRTPAKLSRNVAYHHCTTSIY